jgi:hypothetical protein
VPVGRSNSREHKPRLTAYRFGVCSAGGTYRLVSQNAPRIIGQALSPTAGSWRPAEHRCGRFYVDGVDAVVISLSAKGLTTGEVEADLAGVY